MKPHRLLLPVVSLGLVPLGAARAQEALFYAIENETVVLARSSRPQGKVLGPLNWYATGTFRADYNDNIQQDNIDELSDFILRPGVDLGLNWPISQRASLSVGFGVQYAAYVEHSNNNYLEISPDSAVSLSMTLGDVVLTVFNRLSYSEDVHPAPEITGRARYPRLENQAGITAVYTPSNWQFSGGFTHYNFWPMDDDFRRLERASQQLHARATYLFSPGTRAGLEGSAAFTDYVEETRRDFNSYSAGPYVAWTIVDGLQMTARGGVVRIDQFGNSVNPNDYSFDSYYFGGSLGHRLTDFIRHSVSATHGIDVGINADFNQTTVLSYDIAWQMTAVWDVSAGVRYEHGKRPSGTSGLNEDYDRYVLQAGLSRSLSSRLSLSARYRYTQRESNFSTRDYNQNLISLTLRYRF